MEELIISGLAGMDVFPTDEECEPKKRRGAEQRRFYSRSGDPEQTSWGGSPTTEDDLINSGLAGMDLFLPTAEPPPSLTPPTPYKPDPPRVFVEELHVIPDYRGRWDALFGGEYGSFEDQTSLGPMRHTFGPIPRYAVPECTFQFFHIRVANLRDGLRWPLHVHGLVAARDHVDHNRNFLFHRTRDNSQIITQEDPYLLLTGPSRAIMVLNPITLEIQLKVKSKTEPEKDETLAFSISNYHQTYFMEKVIWGSSYCRRCNIELAYASLIPSVEATVAGIQVVDGTWPDCFRGRVAARITSVEEGTVSLLDSRDGAMPISCSTGAIEARCFCEFDEGRRAGYLRGGLSDRWRRRWRSCRRARRGGLQTQKGWHEPWHVRTWFLQGTGYRRLVASFHPARRAPCCRETWDENDSWCSGEHWFGIEGRIYHLFPRHR